MIFNLGANNPSPGGIFSGNDDPERFERIKKALCERRYEVEKILKDENITPEVREENALLLIEKKHNLEVFGISEVDYQAFLAKKDQEEQPSLF